MSREAASTADPHGVVVRVALSQEEWEAFKAIARRRRLHASQLAGQTLRNLLPKGH